MVFVGVQPTLMQVPPRFFPSTSATDHPKSARRNERGLPAWPEPTMMASYFMRGFLQRGAPQDFTSDAARPDKAHRNSPCNMTPSSDRKSTRLNSSHDQISYAVFCLKKKKTTRNMPT